MIEKAFQRLKINIEEKVYSLITLITLYYIFLKASERLKIISIQKS